MPTREEQDHIAEEIFQQTGFPYVMGIIDGTHFELTKPSGITNTIYYFGSPKIIYCLDHKVLFIDIYNINFVNHVLVQ
jgi:hypothetical protein